MAAMTTALTKTFGNIKNAITYSLSTHTAAKARQVIQMAKLPNGSGSVAETVIKVIYVTEDADGNILPSKVSFEAKARYPIDGLQADIDAALVVFRDIVAGDEFTNSVNTQEPLA